MRTVLQIVFILALLLLTVGFTVDVTDIRLEELNYLLGKVDVSEDVSNTLGILGKYELIKKRIQNGEQSVSNYQLEAKIAALSSSEHIEKPKVNWTRKVYRVPVQIGFNVIRLALGKPIVSLRKESDIYKVIEIGYFWERNRKYDEAIKIYNQILSMQRVPPEIDAAVMVHMGFCHSMLSAYDLSKAMYEKVISRYPNTEAGILAWKLLEFIETIETERDALESRTLSDFEKARQSYLYMNYRSAIKYYSVFLQNNAADTLGVQARYFKGRSHEELGETDEAIAEYYRVIKDDKGGVWAREANRRLLMLGEFYAQRKQIAEDARKQLAVYQDNAFAGQVDEYKALVSKSSLRDELIKDGAGGSGKTVKDDSLLNIINKIGDLDLTGEKEAAKQAQLQQLKQDLQVQNKLSQSEALEAVRTIQLSENPFRRPSYLKKTIDENSSQLKYLYNRKIRTGAKLAGKMLVEIQIRPDGRVDKAVVASSNMGDPDFEREVVKTVLSWQFKPVGDALGNLTVKYPFEFSEESSY